MATPKNRTRARVPRVQANHCKNPNHDPSCDAAVVAEFSRRFPGLTFVEFYRLRGGVVGLHRIEFAGTPEDLIASGAVSPSMLPKKKNKRGELFSCNTEPGMRWMINHDRRRGAKLTVKIWLEDDDCVDAMAWLDPKRWVGGRSLRPRATWTVEGNVIFVDWSTVAGGAA